ncbi:Filamin-B [Frankliniella fusca]|uniref:Filamin-B n=1 Tax=Frankliniella fusca TaxID=407009 RepID=A0AAE1HKI5_9NEOP|nr:Filamin-B [Frankliniella fusca]
MIPLRSTVHAAPPPRPAAPRSAVHRNEPKVGKNDASAVCATKRITMTSEEPLRISQVGLAARSPEGHAAKGMAIKGHEDLWVEIQANTFRNWVNENLRGSGMGHVADLAQDFQDGTKLCALVEALQKRPLRGWVRRPANRHQHLENVSCALKAVEADGVKLVNIGNVDIVNGNLKLILGLIWSLIVRYQIGRSKFPPKKLMLAWLRAALPECRVDNFTSDWNSGVALSALLDYCKPGLFPHWKVLDPSDRVENCRTAMEIARREFSIPMVLEPEYLASPYLDELSGMTYLSYFMKENSPGFYATLRWVNNQIPQNPVRNFTSMGGPVPGYKDMTFDPDSWESNLNAGIQGGKRLGVEPILRAKDMANKEVEHLGVMAYAANFQWVRPRSKPGDRIVASADSHHTRVDQQTHFKIEFLEDDIDPREVSVEVVGPGGSKVDCRLNLGPRGGTGTFVPLRVGMHKVIIKHEGEAVKGSPIHYRAMPELTSIQHTGMEPCAVGSIVEVLINSNGTNTNEISVVARSPTGRELDCPVHENRGVHSATFQPDEAGEWTIGVMHGGQHIQGGPFTCFVFDPNGVKLENMDGAQPHAPFSFVLDTTGTGGLGDVELDIVHERRTIPHHVEHLGASLYRVTLNTGRAGKYRVYVYFNGQDVRGSPFPLRVGTQRSREKERIRANLEEREQLKSPQLVESATSPTFKLSSPSPDLDMYQSSSAYKTDAFESDYKSSSNKYDSKYKSTDYVDSGRYKSDYESKYNSSSKFKSDYVTESRQMSSLETGLSRAHITDSLMNGRSSPYRLSPSPVASPSPSPSPSPALYRASSPSASPSLLSPAYHINGVSEKRSENTRVSSMLSQRRGSWDNRDVVLKSQQAGSGILEDKYSSTNLITREQQQSSGLSKRVVTQHQVDHVNAKRMASPLPSPHPDDLDAPVHGDALRLVSVHRTAHFTIDTSFDGHPAADLNQVVVEILSPSRRSVPVRLSRGARRELVEATFTASEVGEHVVDVRVRGDQVRGAPFRTHAYNARAIQVGRIPNGVLGQPVEFEIDGSGAGSGNLEILVNGGHVTSSVRTLGNQRFRASFVPHELLTHVVEMKFNGETVPVKSGKIRKNQKKSGKIKGKSEKIQKQIRKTQKKIRKNNEKSRKK